MSWDHRKCVKHRYSDIERALSHNHQFENILRMKLRDLDRKKQVVAGHWFEKQRLFFIKQYVEKDISFSPEDTFMFKDIPKENIPLSATLYLGLPERARRARMKLKRSDTLCDIREDGTASRQSSISGEKMEYFTQSFPRGINGKRISDIRRQSGLALENNSLTKLGGASIRKKMSLISKNPVGKNLISNRKKQIQGFAKVTADPVTMVSKFSSEGSPPTSEIEIVSNANRIANIESVRSSKSISLVSSKSLDSKAVGKLPNDSPKVSQTANDVDMSGVKVSDIYHAAEKTRKNSLATKTEAQFAHVLKENENEAEVKTGFHMSQIVNIDSPCVKQPMKTNYASPSVDTVDLDSRNALGDGRKQPISVSHVAESVIAVQIQSKSGFGEPEKQPIKSSHVQSSADEVDLVDTGDFDLELRARRGRRRLRSLSISEGQLLQNRNKAEPGFLKKSESIEKLQTSSKECLGGKKIEINLPTSDEVFKPGKRDTVLEVNLSESKKKCPIVEISPFKAEENAGSKDSENAATETDMFDPDARLGIRTRSRSHTISSLPGSKMPSKDLKPCDPIRAVNLSRRRSRSTIEVPVITELTPRIPSRRRSRSHLELPDTGAIDIDSRRRSRSTIDAPDLSPRVPTRRRSRSQLEAPDSGAFDGNIRRRTPGNLDLPEVRPRALSRGVLMLELIDSLPAETTDRMLKKFHLEKRQEFDEIHEKLVVENARMLARSPTTDDRWKKLEMSLVSDEKEETLDL